MYRPRYSRFKMLLALSGAYVLLLVVFTIPSQQGPDGPTAALLLLVVAVGWLGSGLAGVARGLVAPTVRLAVSREGAPVLTNSGPGVAEQVEATLYLPDTGKRQWQAGETALLGSVAPGETVSSPLFARVTEEGVKLAHVELKWRDVNGGRYRSIRRYSAGAGWMLCQAGKCRLCEREYRARG
jgi:hypothetical protein